MSTDNAARAGELTLHPGRELDALVAEKVMGLPAVVELRPAFPARGWPSVVGWQTNPYGPDDDNNGIMYSPEPGANRSLLGYQPKPYSTDISAAWLVVDKLINELCGDFALECSNATTWYADFRSGWAHADTPALAICLAALKAMEAV